MKNVKFAVIKDGKVIRHGICQEENISLQAGDGETVEEFDSDKHAIAHEEVVIPMKKVKERELYSLVPLLMESFVDESKKTELIDAINKVLK